MTAAIAHQTLVDLLRHRAASPMARPAYTLLTSDDFETESMSYSDLDRRARSYAVLLAQHLAPGERALLLYPQSLEFLGAFFGCLYAGVIAVPTYPLSRGRSGRFRADLDGILASSQASLVLTTPEIHAACCKLFPGWPRLASLTWLTSDRIAQTCPDQWLDPGSDPASIAFLQYTSGSTGYPNGVVVSHGNLLANQQLIRAEFGTEESDHVLGWLPFYHDMGLIGNLLHPLFLGIPCTLMSPMRFLRSPFLWLEAISAFGGTVSGGPNFAFDLCCERIDATQRDQLDLSRWRIAFCGAEPIRDHTLTRFAETFGPCGFDPTALLPCYGLAEATLMVTAGPVGAPPRKTTVSRTALADHLLALPKHDDSVTLVSSGRVSPSLRLRIVDPDACRPTEGVGEIWVAGDSVAGSYWDRPQESRETFDAHLPGERGPFLRTGDLGFLLGDFLFVTGRLKDLVIIRGRNYYPHDIEAEVEDAHASFRRGCVAAFSVDVDQEERLVVVQEVSPRLETVPPEASDAVHRVVGDRFNLRVHAVVFIKAGTLPKTTSGKVRRGACKKAWLTGGLTVIHEEVIAAVETGERSPLEPAALETAPIEERQRILLTWLTTRTAELLGRDTARLRTDEPLVTSGLDSLMAVTLREDLTRSFGFDLPVQRLFDDLSLEQLAADLSEHVVRWEGRGSRPTMTVPAQTTGDCPLAYAQQSIWLAEKLGNAPGANNIPSLIRLRGPLDVIAMEQAFNRIVARHESLRTVFLAEPEGVIQRVLPPGSARIPIIALAGAPEDAFARADGLARTEASRRFDLERGPLFHLHLLQLGPEDHLLLFNVHHIAADGWSMGLMIDELAHFYRAFQLGRVARLPPLPLCYSEFAVHQRASLDGAHLEGLRTWWSRELADVPALVLPFDRNGTEDGRGRRLVSLLPPSLAATLTAGARELAVTPHVLMLAAFYTLLQRYTGQRDLLVGVAHLGRDLPGTTALVGNFINMLALRTLLDPDLSLARLVARVSGVCREALAHQELPYELLVADGRARGKSYQALQVAFGTQNLPRHGLHLPGLTVEQLDPDFGSARYPLTLWVSETRAGLVAAWTFATARFEDATVAGMHRDWQALLELFATDPDKRCTEAMAELDRRVQAQQHQNTLRAARGLGGRLRRNPSRGEVEQ